jgi:site-specific recombinase
MLPTISKILRRASRMPAEWTGLLRRDLSSLLAAADPAASLGERIAWLEDLLAWIRLPGSPSAESSAGAQIQAVRVRFLLQTLERNPDWKIKTTAVLSSLLTETEPMALFCETGLSAGDGFFSEAIERLLRKFLPAPRDDHDLAELFHRVFMDVQDADWLENLDPSAHLALLSLLSSDSVFFEKLQSRYQFAMEDALIFLASQLESLGLNPDIRLRSHLGSIRDSDFHRLRQLVSEAIKTKDGSGIPAQTALCRSEIAECLQHLEEFGVSVAIVYRLELMERLLARIDLVAAILFGNSALWPKLLAELIRSTHERKRVGGLIQDNFHLLARKIVERTGASGEHYITQTPREYFLMLSSAGGGGVLTAATATVKLAITNIRLPPFFEGLFSWINYSGSFLIMQACHFTLATKQPSMTAPALAAKIKAARTKQDFQDFADEVAKITRSQFAAALGNVGAVIPTAFLADFLLFKTSGSHIFPMEYALKTIHSLHPFQSLTLPFAALTGVFLWLSSVAAGWAENWFVYRRLPEAIAQAEWMDLTMGKKRSRRFSQWIAKNVAGVAGNISLGFLLSFTAVSGRFFGFPLDVRHVTLSAGALSFACAALPEGTLSGSQILAAWAGVLLIGILNFGVSFALALSVAVKASSIRRAKISIIIQAIWTGFRTQPLRFFFPVQNKS